MKIYAGNLSQEVTETDLRQAFEQFGAVASATLLKDKMTGASRGFAFVEMVAKEQATAAITGLNGRELKGKNLTVNEARPAGGGGGTGGGGGYRGGFSGFGGGGRGGRGHAERKPGRGRWKGLLW